MAVLIEALALVVPRRVLDVSYPGGTDAYLQDALAHDPTPRYIVSDDQLAAVGFMGPDDVLTLTRRLQDHGIVWVDGDECQEMVVIDQAQGPTMPCSWVEWRRHAEGFTYAWSAGTDAGDMATYEEWTPENSRNLTRHDVRDDTERWLRLSREGEIETWLDLETGIMSRGLEPEASDSVTESDDSFTTTMTENPHDETPLSLTQLDQAVIAAFEQLQWSHTSRNGWHVAGVSGKHCNYEVTVRCFAEMDLVMGYCLIPHRIPSDRRTAIAETITRANFGLRLGLFEMDFTDGELRYRVSADVEDGVLSPKMVENMILSALGQCDRYLPAILSVTYGGAAPGSAIESVEGGE